MSAPEVSFGNTWTILASSGSSSNPVCKPVCVEFIMFPSGSRTWIGLSFHLRFLSFMLIMK